MQSMWHRWFGGVFRIASAVPVYLAVFAIRLYQFSIRPLLSGSCKFIPSCSEYGVESLLQHGFFRGVMLTVRRVARCHPFSVGGIDPVPHECPPRHSVEE